MTCAAGIAVHIVNNWMLLQDGIHQQYAGFVIVEKGRRKCKLIQRKYPID
jgi:hypothetical protein